MCYLHLKITKKYQNYGFPHFAIRNFEYIPIFWVKTLEFALQFYFVTLQIVFARFFGTQKVLNPNCDISALV